MSTLRIFEVPAAQGGDPRELDAIVITATGDQAKSAAHVALSDMGFDVRSLNWAPDPREGSKQPVLLAYVAKKAGT